MDRMPFWLWTSISQFQIVKITTIIKPAATESQPMPAPFAGSKIVVIQLPRNTVIPKASPVTGPPNFAQNQELSKPFLRPDSAYPDNVS